jgi:hypothetical protein
VLLRVEYEEFVSRFDGVAVYPERPAARGAAHVTARIIWTGISYILDAVEGTERAALVASSGDGLIILALDLAHTRLPYYHRVECSSAWGSGSQKRWPEAQVDMQIMTKPAAAVMLGHERYNPRSDRLRAAVWSYTYGVNVRKSA